MPLVQGASESARRENVRRLLAEGRSPSQALAIARSVQERARRRHRRDQNTRAERTARQVAIAREIVGRRRRRRARLPRQVPPNAIARDYTREVVELVDRALSALDPLRAELPDLLSSARRERERLDAGEGRRLQELIAQVEAVATAAVAPSATRALARQFALRTSTYQRLQLQKQVRAALGADIFAADPNLEPIFDTFAAENAALIRDVPQKVVNEVALLSTRAVASGTLHKDLADQIQERVAIGQRRARLIARDQVGKLYGQLNVQRQRAMGVEHFIWRTSADRRVRPEHVTLEGRRFPTNEGAPGEGLPGEPVLCRCYAEPDFSAILEL